MVTRLLIQDPCVKRVCAHEKSGCWNDHGHHADKYNCRNLLELQEISGSNWSPATCLYSVHATIKVRVPEITAYCLKPVLGCARIFPADLGKELSQ